MHFTTILLFLLIALVLCAEDYYKVLGIDKSASEKDIKKAYRTLSKKWHPDKNPGDATAHDKFVSIAEAYDILSDPETRKIYDQYGHEGLEQHKRGGPSFQQHDPFDLFSRFFGGSGHFGHAPGQRRGNDQEVRIDLPLSDFYTGKEREFVVEKQVICDECDGTGSEDGVVETCGHCGGRGMLLQKHMLAPGIFQQVQMACDKCGGKGKTIRKPCPVCHGDRVVRKAQTYTLNVEPGMDKNTIITFENEADESPDWTAGDLHVRLDILPPTLGKTPEEKTDGTFFRRKGKELFWREVLSLREAWMGDWERNLTHLDGHVVHLGRKRGQVVQPMAVEVIPGEGMPVWHQDRDEDEEWGNLNVEYVVVLPDQMEGGMEKDFHAMWEKWRKRHPVDLGMELGRGEMMKESGKDEL
ncbi:MAG: DnaJ- protein scj1 [Cirrosporium novae-zelandiae]|nr:MAG: DnaJ- protein scj1 [Cirrosporium novae-zelandiae]